MYCRSIIKWKKKHFRTRIGKLKNYAGMLFPLVMFIQRFKSYAILRYAINLKYSVIFRKT